MQIKIKIEVNEVGANPAIYDIECNSIILSAYGGTGSINGQQYPPFKDSARTFFFSNIGHYGYGILEYCVQHINCAFVQWVGPNAGLRLMPQIIKWWLKTMWGRMRGAKCQ